ncbi:FRG domain-containing protein [Myroides odoratimimus]|uniref:FRG domain-containing protein n=1 Tax=Myroides odoratimimus TaxID=76832 RepID=A0AAI8C7R7_9FLAO|nr:FRG domain-containing protein [Myroides odoratimimus]ALU28218.1 hypothetical protein AS202_19615 [Myroides odoratimimus]MDM1036748.1 FRG domain-containing protein [Myroides odoratimimus]MDM1051145.1 FRG domain-containing protein [Myroides odoratimimus]MDM1458291.1 FRG domain-containing protein [Myroides odoratimimus]
MFRNTTTIHKVKDIVSAIKLAEELSIKNEYDFFRGQRKIYDLLPTIKRENVDQKESILKLKKFDNWIHNTPELKSLHNNQISILAVAQHYGMNTNLIDFSYSPRIAGYFASDGAKNGDYGEIICLNKKKFTESWLEINDFYFKHNNILLTEIIEIEVKNLWRLEAQKGLFLKSQIDSTVLEMFSHFLRIQFPQNENIISPIDESEVYPKNKSHLEVLLDQFSLIESYSDRFKNFHENYDVIINTSESEILNEVNSYFIDDILPPILNSWLFETQKQWLCEPYEKVDLVKNKFIAKLVIPNMSNHVEFERNIQEQLYSIFKSNNSSKSIIDWQLVFENNLECYLRPEEDDFALDEVKEIIDVIYSGMRLLPFTIDNIIISITKFIVMAKFSATTIIEDWIGIETEGNGIRGRGFCSKEKVKNTLRNDYYDYIKKEKLLEKKELEVKEILFTSRNINRFFEFDNFLKLFVEDIIPSQAVCRIEEKNLNLNPMKIYVMGLS